RVGGGGRTVGNPETQLEHRRVIEQALRMHLSSQPDMTHVEALELRFDAQLLDTARRRAQHRRRADIGKVAVTVVQGAAVEGADLGQQLLDMLQPLERTNQIRALTWLQRIGFADDVVAAHTRAEIDDDVDATTTNALDDLAVPIGMAATLPGLRIADVDVGDRGTGSGGLDHGVRDLLR